ncbi:hypothetical protein K439DRAFT_60380 [Ramaria rubella]|nr:hypothetical protein K439DRAFT_60380 [Ramaria rubella]
MHMGIVLMGVPKCEIRRVGASSGEGGWILDGGVGAMVAGSDAAALGRRTWAAENRRASTRKLQT